jgi:hypothetical protein
LDTFDPDDIRMYIEEINWIGGALKVDVDDPIRELEETAEEQEEEAQREEEERERERRRNTGDNKKTLKELMQQLETESGDVTDREIESLFTSLR